VNQFRSQAGAAPRRNVLARSIKSYNHRYREIVKALVAVRREQIRLEKTLD
jgi:hypothetical protein